MPFVTNPLLIALSNTSKSCFNTVGIVSYYDFVIYLKNLLQSKSTVISVKDSDFPSKGFKPLKTSIKSIKIDKLPYWKDSLSRYIKDKYEA